MKIFMDNQTVMDALEQATESARPAVEVYSSMFCPYCSMALRLLDNKGIEYQLHKVDFALRKRAEMRQRSGRTSVPQIFIGDTHVGGCDELYALEHAGQLDALLDGHH